MGQRLWWVAGAIGILGLLVGLAWNALEDAPDANIGAGLLSLAGAAVLVVALSGGAIAVARRRSGARRDPG